MQMAGCTSLFSSSHLYPWVLLTCPSLLLIVVIIILILPFYICLTCCTFLAHLFFISS